MERIWTWIAWHLPRQLVYWCAIRVGAHATTGEWGHLLTIECTVLDALKRWDKGDGSWLQEARAEEGA